ncbi:MAG: DUF4258 domain-containing protein [Rhodospirillaceae bacterium]|nr:DUF4258 domain-containing protein [Rhodospirillaceae bacterium]
MDCRRIVLTKHVLRRMQERRIRPSAVFEIVAEGGVVEERHDIGEDVCVLLGFPDGRALHVVVSRNPLTAECNVKTVYYPNPDEWNAGFRRRR